MKYEIKYKELTEYLETLKYRDFWDESSENYMQKAYTTKELEFSKNKDRFEGEQFIDYGMPYLVDVLGNDLSLVWSTKKKHKLKTCSGVRSLSLKFDRTLIKDCRTVLGSCVNGYWAIPKRFIIESI
jgi:hypothetical protein